MSLLIRGLLESIIPDWKPRTILILVTLFSLVVLLIFGRADQNGASIEHEATAPQEKAKQVVTFRDEPDTEIEDEAGLEVSSQTAPAASSTNFEPSLADAELSVVRQPEIDVRTVDVVVDSYQSTGNIASLFAPNIESAPLLVPNIELERILIPAIDLDVPVTELGWHTTADEEGLIFSQWDVADNAAGWHKDSARPGDGGNVVMSGHNNILGAVFRELDQLDRGDQVLVQSGNSTYSYEIESIMVVPETFASPEQRADNAQWIEQFGDDRITLVSCWPRDDNSHRIIVVGYATGLN